MTERTVEDRLREEYFGLLPEMRRVAWQLEAEVRHCIMPMWVKLDQYERLDTTSRIKDCESAVDKLRRHQETRAFDRGHPDQYTLLDLKDLVGIRIHVFPGSRIEEVRLALCERYPSWTAEPFSGIDGTEERRALKYVGYCSSSSRVRAELQIVSALIGLFWEVEHAAFYKLDPRLKGVSGSLALRERYQDVIDALQAFEREFEGLIHRASRAPEVGKKD